MKKCRQRNSGIGGQAVLEGVMMRNGEDYAIAVRKSDGSIVLKKEKYRGFFADSPLKKIPFIRGVFVFIDSMVLGLRCTDYSASVYAEDDPEEEREQGGKASAGGKKPQQEAATRSAAAEEHTGLQEQDEKAPAAVEKSLRKTETGAVAAGLQEQDEKASAAVEKSSRKAGAAAAEVPEQEKMPKQEEKQEQEPLWERILMGGVTVVSFALAIGLFIVLPFFLGSHLVRLIGNPALLSLFEGVIRILIFILYILLISQMKDIRRLFMYHGAEHKCINCIEGGNELTVENAAKATRLHKRCGSSFILFVMMVSIILFFFIRVSNPVIRVALRILLLPVISGISYELIRFAGSSDDPLIALLSKPGLWLQRLTTREPDAEMLEVAIASVEAVFDWREYLEKQ